MVSVPFVLAALAVTAPAVSQKPFYRSELIFPTQKLHNHGSCVVELPGGDLMAVWYRGSGERRADDVAIHGARLRKGGRQWTKPLVFADTPGFPDTNPCSIVDPKGRFWVFWVTVQDNQWESGLLKYVVSSNYTRADRAPVWQTEKVLHIKPGPEFQETVNRELPAQYAAAKALATPDQQREIDADLTSKREMLQKTLTVRLGWMTRPHPTILDGKRLIVPLYSDGFDFSLMTYTDDWGATWQVSAPMPGLANVQPSLVQRKDGSLVAYMRDNGPPPQRVPVSESRDRGVTWSPVRDSEVVDSGAGVEAIVLKSGRWLLVSNDVERGRHRLGMAISEDEGATWPWVTYLEDDSGAEGPGSYSYPSIIQASDGAIHVTYSYSPNNAARKRLGEGESIKHAHFNEAWLLSMRKPR